MRGTLLWHMALQRAGLPASWGISPESNGRPPAASSNDTGTGLCLFTHSVPLVQGGPGACHFRVLISSSGPLSPSGKVCKGQSSSQQVCAKTPIFSVLLGGWAKKEQGGAACPVPTVAEPFSWTCSKRWSAVSLGGLGAGTSWAQCSGKA